MKVGEYIRTDDGLIGKVVSEPYEYKDSIGCDIDFGNNDIYNEYEMHQSIIKSSPNIIDLIEVGDFIGKTIVEEVKEFDDGTRIIVMADGFDEYDENEYFLKAGIVTHEQFSQMEYRIGG